MLRTDCINNNVHKSQDKVTTPVGNKLGQII